MRYRVLLQYRALLQYRVLRALMMLFAAHAHPCSVGNTPLKRVADENNRNVTAFLRSFGAPE